MGDVARHEVDRASHATIEPDATFRDSHERADAIEQRVRGDEPAEPRVDPERRRVVTAAQVASAGDDHNPDRARAGAQDPDETWQRGPEHGGVEDGQIERGERRARVRLVRASRRVDGVARPESDGERRAAPEITIHEQKTRRTWS